MAFYVLVVRATSPRNSLLLAAGLRKAMRSKEIPTKYKSRPAATEYLREQRGLEIGDNRLADLAYADKGPKFVIINGRACYTDEWLNDWVEQEASRPVRRHRRSQRAQSAA